MEKKYLGAFVLGVIIAVVLKQSGLTINDIMFWNIVVPVAVVSGIILKKV